MKIPETGNQYLGANHTTVTLKGKQCDPLATILLYEKYVLSNLV